MKEIFIFVFFQIHDIGSARFVSKLFFVDMPYHLYRLLDFSGFLVWIYCKKIQKIDDALKRECFLFGGHLLSCVSKTHPGMSHFLMKSGIADILDDMVLGTMEDYAILIDMTGDDLQQPDLLQVRRLFELCQTHESVRNKGVEIIVGRVLSDPLCITRVDSVTPLKDWLSFGDIEPDKFTAILRQVPTQLLWDLLPMYLHLIARLPLSHEVLMGGKQIVEDRIRELNAAVLFESGFIEAFLLKTSLSAFCELMKSDIFRTVFSDILSIPSACVLCKQVWARVIESAELFDEKILCELCVSYMLKLPHAPLVKQILRLNRKLSEKVVFETLMHCQEATRRAFIAAKGIDWLFASAARSPEISDYCLVILGALVAEHGYDEVETSFQELPIDHPIFKGSDDQIEKAMYGLYEGLGRCIRIYSLYSLVCNPSALTAYDEYMLGYISVGSFA
jgi:hypothetical protein